MFNFEKVFLMEGMWTRFFPAVVKAKELLASGAIGRVVAVHADFGFVCGDAPDSRMFAPALAGGGLLDIGIYPLALASLAFGGVAPTCVKASGTQHPTTGVDTSAGVTALYDDPAAHPDLPNMAGGAPGNGRALFIKGRSALSGMPLVFFLNNT